MLSGSVLVDTDLKRLIKEGRIKANQQDVKPCSLDLPVGASSKIYRINGIPNIGRGFSSQKVIGAYRLSGPYSAAELRSGAYLSRDDTFLIQLDSKFKLDLDEWGYANPKSSSGRLDILSMVLAEGSTEFNVIPRGYAGPLWMIVVPQSFPLLIKPQVSLVQLRIIKGNQRLLGTRELLRIHRNQSPLVLGEEVPDIRDDRLVLHLNLAGAHPSNLIAHSRGEPIPLDVREELDPTKFFYEKRLDDEGNLWLEPDEFALLVTAEQVHIPPVLCAEMEAQNQLHGEYRSHFAGFFDSGFMGPGVCEVRNVTRVSIALSHGQAITRLMFMDVAQPPEVPYGADSLGSHYQGQTGVTTSKHFKPWPK